VSGSDALLCDKFQAAFISPRIANSILTDPTIDEMMIENATSRTFELLSRLICGEGLVIDDGNVELLLDLIESLDNVELSESVLKFAESCEGLNVSNCILRFKRKQRLGVECDGERAFLASHVSEIDLENIRDLNHDRDLDLDLVTDILQSDSLRIPSEDWLLDFVFELGPHFRGLIGSIRFEYLNPSSIDLL
jgi:hypothetical protein